MAMKSLFNMFGRSPFNPLQKHMKVVFECASELVLFFEKTYESDWKAAEEIREKITKLESKADVLKRDIRLHLPKGIFMPVARPDLLKLLSRQDRIANLSKDISGLVLGRQMIFPEGVQEDFMTFLKRCVDAVYHARKTIKELDKVFEAGFRGKEIEIVNKMVDLLSEIESETDQIQIRVRRAIHEIESKLSPVDAIFLYKIIEWTGDLANLAQGVGETLLLMISK